MLIPYEHQAEAANLLGEGDLIYFTERGSNSTNSGTVGYVDDTNIDINNVNGDGDSITRKLEDIILFYDTDWDDSDNVPSETKPKDEAKGSVKGLKHVSISFFPGGTAYPIRMTIGVPKDTDPEEYIDAVLDGLLNEFLRYNSEWEFV